MPKSSRQRSRARIAGDVQDLALGDDRRVYVHLCNPHRLPASLMPSGLRALDLAGLDLSLRFSCVSSANTTDPCGYLALVACK